MHREDAGHLPRGQDQGSEGGGVFDRPAADIAETDHHRVCCREGIASGHGLLWNPWQRMPKAYRVFVAMPALPQLKSAPLPQLKCAPEADCSDVYLVTHDFTERRVGQDGNLHLSIRWLQDKILRNSTIGKRLNMDSRELITLPLVRMTHLAPSACSLWPNGRYWCHDTHTIAHRRRQMF